VFFLASRLVLMDLYLFFSADTSDCHCHDIFSSFIEQQQSECLLFLKGYGCPDVSARISNGGR
jgi:hypothetical protein